MGIKNSPDIFQAIISKVMQGLDYVRAYIDDILIISSGTYEDHLEKTKEVLIRLEKAGGAVNVRKSVVAVTDLEYLGFCLVNMERYSTTT
jgi:hypothetical protein